MQPINLGNWSATKDKKLISKYLDQFQPLDLSRIQCVIPFKNYEFRSGEFGNIVTELQENNPAYSVIGITCSPYDLIIIQTQVS